MGEHLQAPGVGAFTNDEVVERAPLAVPRRTDTIRAFGHAAVDAVITAGEFTVGGVVGGVAAVAKPVRQFGGFVVGGIAAGAVATYNFPSAVTSIAKRYGLALLNEGVPYLKKKASSAATATADTVYNLATGEHRLLDAPGSPEAIAAAAGFRPVQLGRIKLTTKCPATIFYHRIIHECVSQRDAARLYVQLFIKARASDPSVFDPNDAVFSGSARVAHINMCSHIASLIVIAVIFFAVIPDANDDGASVQCIKLLLDTYLPASYFVIYDLHHILPRHIGDFFTTTSKRTVVYPESIPHRESIVDIPFPFNLFLVLEDPVVHPGIRPVTRNIFKDDPRNHLVLELVRPFLYAENKLVSFTPTRVTFSNYCAITEDSFVRNVFHNFNLCIINPFSTSAFDIVDYKLCNDPAFTNFVKSFYYRHNATFFTALREYTHPVCVADVSKPIVATTIREIISAFDLAPAATLPLAAKYAGFLLHTVTASPSPIFKDDVLFKLVAGTLRKFIRMTGNDISEYIFGDLHRLVSITPRNAKNPNYPFNILFNIPYTGIQQHQYTPINESIMPFVPDVFFHPTNSTNAIAILYNQDVYTHIVRGCAVGLYAFPIIPTDNPLLYTAYDAPMSLPHPILPQLWSDIMQAQYALGINVENFARQYSKLLISIITIARAYLASRRGEPLSTVFAEFIHPIWNIRWLADRYPGMAARIADKIANHIVAANYNIFGNVSHVRTGPTIDTPVELFLDRYPIDHCGIITPESSVAYNNDLCIITCGVSRHPQFQPANTRIRATLTDCLRVGTRSEPLSQSSANVRRLVTAKMPPHPPAPVPESRIKFDVSASLVVPDDIYNDAAEGAKAAGLMPQHTDPPIDFQNSRYAHDVPLVETIDQSTPLPPATPNHRIATFLQYVIIHLKRGATDTTVPYSSPFMRPNQDGSVCSANVREDIVANFDILFRDVLQGFHHMDIDLIRSTPIDDIISALAKAQDDLVRPQDAPWARTSSLASASPGFPLFAARTPDDPDPPHNARPHFTHTPSQFPSRTTPALSQSRLSQVPSSTPGADVGPSSFAFHTPDDSDSPRRARPRFAQDPLPTLSRSRLSQVPSSTPGADVGPPSFAVRTPFRNTRPRTPGAGAWPALPNDLQTGLTPSLRGTHLSTPSPAWHPPTDPRSGLTPSLHSAHLSTPLPQPAQQQPPSSLSPSNLPMLQSPNLSPVIQRMQFDTS